MNHALTVLVAISASAVLSLVLGVIGAWCTRKVVVRHVENIPIAVTVHKGCHIAAVAGFVVVLAVLVPTSLSFLYTLMAAIVTSAIGYLGTKALLDLLQRKG